ncbi:MAG: cation:proton antiporter, partial [Myxococcota bacterium]
NDLALGLIALEAGLELNARQIRAVGRTLAATIVAKLVIAVPLVAGTLFAVQATTGLLDLDSNGQLIAIALVIGTLSIGTSPAIALAVMNESRARGRLMDLVLGAAAVKDLVVVMCLAIAVAVAATQVSADAALDADVVIKVGKKLGSSILAGVILGVLLIAYIRYVKAEMLLFVTAMIVVVNVIGDGLSLKPLLVFIAAGFVVRNFSDFEHDLMHPLEMVSLPVFVVFFTIAGAKVDLVVIWTVLPLALALCGARAIGYAASGWIGGWIGGESDGIKRKAWQGYLPQAGVTLGLTALAAKDLAPIDATVASTIDAVGTAVVALNLLVGPITLRSSLKSLGEIPEQPADGAHDGDEHGHGHGAEPVPMPVDGPATAPVPAVSMAERESALEDAVARLEHPELATAVTALCTALDRATTAVVTEELAPWAQERAAVAVLPLDVDDVDDADGAAIDYSALRSWADQPSEDAMDRVAALAVDMQRRMSDVLFALSSELTVPLETGNRRIMPGDSLSLRLAKIGRRVIRAASLGLVGRRRRVPLQLCARIALEPRLVALAPELVRSAARALAGVYDELRSFAAADESEAEAAAAAAKTAIVTIIDDWHQRFADDTRSAVLDGGRALAESLAVVDSAAMPLGALRYSEIEPDLAESAQAMTEEPGQWKSALAAVRGGLRLALTVSRLRYRVDQAIAEMALGPIGRATELARPALAAVQARMTALHEELLEVEEPERAVLEAAAVAIREVMTPAEQAALDAAGVQFRPTAALHSVALELREYVALLPEELTVAARVADISTIERPGDIHAVDIDIRERAHRALVRELLPRIDEAMREAGGILASVAPRIREIQDIIHHAIETLLGLDDPGGGDPGELRRVFDRSEAELAEMTSEAGDGVEHCQAAITTEVDQTIAALHDVAAGVDRGDGVLAGRQSLV